MVTKCVMSHHVAAIIGYFTKEIVFPYNEENVCDSHRKMDHELISTLDMERIENSAMKTDTQDEF